MARDHSLDLKQNSIDSLEESINFYQLAVADESKYKFCIILYFHFVELLLKSCIEEINPLLCYVKPYSEKIAKEKTVSWGQAIQVLINSGNSFNADLKKQIISLSKIRNNIIHYKFEYNTNEIRKVITDTMSGLAEFYEDLTGENILDCVNEKTKSLLGEIESEYSRELHLAQAEALEEADGESDDVKDCEICGSQNTAVWNNEGSLHCFYCEENDRLEECGRCTTECRTSEMSHFGRTEDGDIIYMCDACLAWMDEQ